MRRDGDDFHHALRAAIRSSERYDQAKATVEHSSKLNRDAQDLITASRQLVHSAKQRVASGKRP